MTDQTNDNAPLPVLLVEDNPGDARLLREYLLMADRRVAVVVAESLGEAFERHEQRPVSIVLLDLSLPDSRGIETVERLLERTPDVPVIVLTGVDDEELALEAVRAGAQDYLVKGRVGSEVLARAMRYAIERHRLLGEERELHQRESEFVATASHELRTPLHSIRGFTRLLLDQTVEPRVQREFLTTIDIEANRLSVIVSDLLDVARIETGSLELRYEELDLPELVAEACAALAPNAAEKNIELRQDLHEGRAALVTDRACLSRALVNLIGNAVKFTDAGGAVTVRVTAADGEATISVQDTGPGIPQESRSRLFQRFSQLDASSTREHGGTGLGLYITKQLVESLQGRIWLESEVGLGSTFYVALPLCAEAALEQAA